MKQPCDPGPGKTLLTIGQDLVSIEQYVSMQMEHQQQQQQQQQPQQQEQPTYQSMAFDPAATMVYTDIQTLRGLDQPVDYGSGIEYAQGLTETYSHSGIQLGLWLNGTSGCQDIVEGRLEDNIRKLYTIIDQWKTPKVFLRVGYGTSKECYRYRQCKVPTDSIGIIQYTRYKNDKKQIYKTHSYVCMHDSFILFIFLKNLTIPILDIPKILPSFNKPFKGWFMYVKKN